MPVADMDAMYLVNSPALAGTAGEEEDARLFVAERSAGRGYAVLWHGSPQIVAATHPGVAVDLLRDCLAQGSAEEEICVRWIADEQPAWAVPVVLQAGLSLSPAGPIRTRGELGPLTPYLPRGPLLWRTTSDIPGDSGGRTPKPYRS